MNSVRDIPNGTCRHVEPPGNLDIFPTCIVRPLRVSPGEVVSPMKCCGRAIEWVRMGMSLGHGPCLLDLRFWQCRLCNNQRIDTFFIARS